MELGAKGLSPADRKGNGGGSRFPLRALRYWFMYQLILREFETRQRPLAVCEIGMGTGEMLAFLRAAATDRRPWSTIIGRWDGLGLGIDRALMAARGYSQCVEQNLEGPALKLAQRYDVIVFLHVLEHLRDPEACFARTLVFLTDGGVCIGGSPGIPHVLVRYRERQLQRAAQPFGHISAFSPRRVKALATRNGLIVEFLSGAYLMRNTGSVLENYGWWVRLNLAFGAVVPGWPGELYWALRKPFPVLPSSTEDSA